ncbi:MAG: hypothetical protein ACIAS6_02390 [Phycisphaerales bacterium JB060]
MAVQFCDWGIVVRSPAMLAPARELWRVRHALRQARLPRTNIPVRLRLGRLPAFTVTI